MAKLPIIGLAFALVLAPEIVLAQMAGGSAVGAPPVVSSVSTMSS